jgi:hypothetical protein
MTARQMPGGSPAAIGHHLSGSMCGARQGNGMPCPRKHDEVWDVDGRVVPLCAPCRRAMRLVSAAEKRAETLDAKRRQADLFGDKR